jgi:micrococcal nuclease
MKMKYISLLCLFILTTLIPCSCNPEPNKSQANSLEELTYLSIKKIVDGDTFWVEDGTEKGLKIRLIGVDAPESRKTFKKEVGFYGKEAKAYLTSLLKGKKVKLEYDVNRTDQYGRTLAYVYLSDGTFVNADLVKNGYATVMTVPPNVKFAEEFLKLQQEAKENERGLWGVSVE